LLILPLANAQTLVLQRTFIEKYKNRATIDALFVVDLALPQPHPPAEDGDLHAAGRSSQVGLPMVSEVMNAALDPQKNVVHTIQANQGNGTATAISGAWRIWFEHPSTQPQVQFAPVPPAASTNPDHCFEIHPITQYAGKQIPQSLQDIQGYTPKDAQTAFGNYEKLSTTLVITAQTISLTSKQIGDNYVKFIAQLAGKPVALDKNDAGQVDGQVVLVNILNNAGDQVLVNNVRLIFIAGTPPADALSQAGNGATLQLLAIPRVDLNAISAFAGAGGSGTVVRKLPYEMIVVSAKSAGSAPAPPIIARRTRGHS
jgi:hypothetical protein